MELIYKQKVVLQYSTVQFCENCFKNIAKYFYVSNESLNSLILNKHYNKQNKRIICCTVMLISIYSTTFILFYGTKCFFFAGICFKFKTKTEFFIIPISLLPASVNY